MDRSIPPSLPVEPPARAESLEGRLLFNAAWDVFPTLATADFTGDGSSEALVVVRGSRARMADLGFIGRGFRRGAVLLLDGEGGLIGGPLALRFAGGGSPQVAVADFNSDGNLDLLVAGARGAGRGLSLMFGNGDGTFSAGTRVAGVPGNVASLATGDFNDDGIADLVVTTRAARRFGGALLGGNGGASLFDPLFRQPTRPSGVGGEAGAGVADVGVPTSFQDDVNARLERNRAVGSTGVSAETGAAAIGGGVRVFVSPLFDEGNGLSGQVVFLGNGDGTFVLAPTGSDDDGSNGTGSGDDDDGFFGLQPIEPGVIGIDR
jgi:hypothetical protein